MDFLSGNKTLRTELCLDGCMKGKYWIVYVVTNRMHYYCINEKKVAVNNKKIFDTTRLNIDSQLRHSSLLISNGF